MLGGGSIGSPCPPSNRPQRWRRKQLLKVAHNLKTLRHVGAVVSSTETTSTKLYPPSPEKKFPSIKMEQKCALPALVGGDLAALLLSTSTPPSSTSQVCVNVNGVNVDVFPANEGSSIGSEQDAQLIVQLIVEQYVRPPMFPRLLWKKAGLAALDREGCKTTASTSFQSKHGVPIRKEDVRKAMYCIIHGGQQGTADVGVSAVCSVVKEQLDDEAIASLREHFLLMWDTFSGLAERVMREMEAVSYL
jgi:hypothetical protein